MTERPILFSTPMVRAILDGKKTVTRRTAKGATRRFGEPGDRLWVRETWRLWGEPDSPGHDKIHTGKVPVPQSDFHAARLAERVEYYADADPGDSPWRPSIFMPRWASRITLEVVDVRRTRLYEMTDDEARLEGVGSLGEFARLWETINGLGSWVGDRDVWRVAFRVAEGGAR